MKESIAVGAVNTRGESDVGKRADFSNYANNLDIKTAGHYVYSTRHDDKNWEGKLNDSKNFLGTSFAAPIVAGEAALFYQMYVLMYQIKPDVWEY